MKLQEEGSAEGGCGEGAGVGARAGRTQGLAEPLPSQQEALAAGSLSPRRHGPRGGDRGCWELSQPSPPKQPRSPGLFTQAPSSVPPSALTLGPLPKITDPCGQEHVPAYLLSSLQANLSTCSARTCHGHSQLGAFVRIAPSAWNALTTSLVWLASMCPSDLCPCITSFRKPSLIAQCGESSPWVHHTALADLCPPFTHPDCKLF